MIEQNWRFCWKTNYKYLIKKAPQCHNHPIICKSLNTNKPGMRLLKQIMKWLCVGALCNNYNSSVKVIITSNVFSSSSETDADSSGEDSGQTAGDQEGRRT